MPEADYNALNALQTYIKDAVTAGLRVWQSQSRAPTERGEPQSLLGSVMSRGNSPSPTGDLLPAIPQPISQGLPMPKAVREGASAEQGGAAPPRRSGPVPPSGKGRRQRSEVPAGEVAKGDEELTTGHDAEIDELRQQV